MNNPQLAEYINKSLDQGKTFEELKPQLLKLGWKEVDVNDTYDACVKNKITDYNIAEHYEEKKFKTYMVWVFVALSILIIGGFLLYYLKFT